MKSIIMCANFDREASSAMLLLLKLNGYVLQGVIASAGRLPVECSYKNAEIVLRQVDSTVPVFLGSDKAMVADMNPLRKTWDKNNPKADFEADDFSTLFDWTDANEKEPKVPGALWLIDYLGKISEPAIIFCCGPLTDIALALRVCPHLVSKIERFIIVGGAHHCADVTASAEFNIWFDPEAAAIVMGSDIPKLLLPLDCAYSASFSMNEMAFSQTNTTIKILKKLIHKDQPMESAHPALLGACCIAKPDILNDVIQYSVDIDFNGGYSDGQTIFDTRRIFNDYNCETSFSAKCDLFLATIREIAESK